MNDPSMAPSRETEVPRMPALTDEMIAKAIAAQQAGGALADEVQSSGLAKAIPTLGAMVESGDVRRLANIARAYAAAEDAVTDEIVGRLGEAVGGGLAFIDQVQRSGVERALPALVELIDNGDLSRLVKLARLYGAAEDAVTEEMVGRLAETVGGGLALMDQVQRSGLERALPALVELVDNGDLARLVKLARLYSAAEDAVTEEMVGRLAETVGAGLSLLDRLSRGGGERIVAMLERLEANGALEKMAVTLPKVLERLDQVQALLECIERAATISDQAPPAAGGVGPLFRTMRDKETQDTLAFFLQLGRQMRTSCPRGS
jgi:hypothetical protein